MSYNKDSITITRSALCISLCIEIKQLSSDIHWGEEALVSQFYWDLGDNVKTMLLTLPEPQTLNEAISLAAKCDNRLFQRRQDQRPRHQTTRHNATTTTRSFGPHLELEYMQIVTAHIRGLTPKKMSNKRRIMFVLWRRKSYGCKLPQEAELAHY